MNKGSIVERLCSDLIAKSRDINGLLYFTLLYFRHANFNKLTTLSLSVHVKLSYRIVSYCGMFVGLLPLPAIIGIAASLGLLLVIVVIIIIVCCVVR